MQADGQCRMCSVLNAMTRCSQQLRRVDFRRALTHCMIFTAVIGSAMASFTIDEPQEDFPESAHPPAQVSWADNIVQIAHPASEMLLYGFWAAHSCPCAGPSGARKLKHALALSGLQRGLNGLIPLQTARRSLKEVLACPPIGLTPLQDFDLANFISAPWYAQAMVGTSATHSMLTASTVGTYKSCAWLSLALTFSCTAWRSARKRIIETLPCSNPRSISQPPPSSASKHFTSPLIRWTSR